jgi:uncharacterized membrane protein YeiB
MGSIIAPRPGASAGNTAEVRESLAPAGAGERITEVDIVRAIALIGIVLVNYQRAD